VVEQKGRIIPSCTASVFRIEYWFYNFICLSRSAPSSFELKQKFCYSVDWLIRNHQPEANLLALLTSTILLSTDFIPSKETSFTYSVYSTKQKQKSRLLPAEFGLAVQFNRFTDISSNQAHW